MCVDADNLYPYILIFCHVDVIGTIQTMFLIAARAAAGTAAPGGFTLNMQPSETVLIATFSNNRPST